MGKKLTQKEFFQKAREVHGDKYDYSKSVYNGYEKKVCITCPKHGEFWQTPHDHIDGHGCMKCRDERTKEKYKGKFTTQLFIKRAKEVHGDKYDYSKAEYINAKTKICIICPIHGEFWQDPHSHLIGRGCKKCGVEKRAKEKRITTEEFIERAKKVHGNKYDYSKTKYININEKVCIICHEKDEFGDEHGEFWQHAEDHLNGFGCKKCSKMYMDTNTFIKKSKKVHGNKYDYSKTEYLGNKKKVCIICSEHGEFWQDPNHHMNGHGCPKCGQSFLEKEIIDLLDENHIKYDYNKRYKFLNNLQLDFYIPSLNIAIECQGEQHFNPIGYFGGEKSYQKLISNDIKKREICEKNGIKLFYYSNLKIKYPYKVIENKDILIRKILYEDKQRGNKIL